MRVIRNQRHAHRTAAGRRVLDGRRATVTGLLLGSLMLVLWSHIDQFSLWFSLRTGVIQRPTVENELVTASILLVPRNGNDCRLRLIENATWRIWDQGVVDCRDVLEQSRPQTHGWSMGRIDVIREGFFKR